METLEIPSLEQPVITNRIIGSYPSGECDGPLFIGIGGIHGNEPGGIFAIKKVLDKLKQDNIPVHGKFIGLAGNLKALEFHQRFIDEDLNRLFLHRTMEAMQTSSELSAEEKELEELVSIINKITKDKPEVYFIDCHTTSSASVPYISVNRYDKSLQLARQFPLFNVIGLEKSIPGCIAEYLNKKGYHGFTFEAGKHNHPLSVENHIAAIWLFLIFTGLVSEDHFTEFDYCFGLLNSRKGDTEISFDVFEHYKIKPQERFRMKPGYVNFQRIEEGEVLATNRHRTIRANRSGRILMPLYQQQGDDGFFVLKKASNDTYD